MADGEASLLMLAWSDDREWLRQQTDVLSVGLPALERAIGLDYPLTGTLSVSEHAYRHLGDYVGLFNPTAATIQMRFDADTFTTLHEAAHVWFNGSLFADRWIIEGFASYYAEVVGTELALEIVPDELTTETAPAAFPLNAWLAPSLDEDDRETYAYAAAPAVAAEIAALAGADGLQEVWQAADEDRLAYAASDDDARTADDAAPASWQRLLDLLENATTADYDPIWREWIVTEAEVPQLDVRESTRASYAETVTAADGWTLPRSTRALMDAWDFAEAEAELREAHAIFEDRGALETDAQELDLVSTGSLRAAFEDDGLDAAAEEVAEQRQALDAIESATAELAPEPGLLEQVGLMGDVPPSRALTRARDEFEAGDDGAAVSGAHAAIDQRVAAGERGRTRVAIGAGVLLALDLAAMGGAFALRRRRRSAGELAPAIPAPPA
jgi:hypothetical protein